MKKLIFLIAFLIPFSVYAQSIDEVFDDNGASNVRNALYFSISDAIRGVPSIMYERNLSNNNVMASYPFLRIGLGLQTYEPLIKIPYYTTQFDNIMLNYLPVKIIDIDSLNNEKFIELSLGFKLFDYIFDTDNYFEGSLSYLRESFLHKGNDLRTKNIIFGIGYFFYFNRIILGLNFQYGFGHVDYINYSDVYVSYKLNLSLGCSF